ncbi:MAG TPA: hypothetical protein VFT22_01240, partial [Kofleriaceae bacterium]|nr:hypothetical protein [Kofleriaceae bacterium]
MAAGKLQTHVAGSEVDLDFLAALAIEAGASEALAAQVRAANTARHVLELCRAAGSAGGADGGEGGEAGGVIDLARVICARACGQLARAAGGALAIEVLLVDFGGALLGRHPEVP